MRHFSSLFRRSHMLLLLAAPFTLTSPLFAQQASVLQSDGRAGVALAQGYVIEPYLDGLDRPWSADWLPDGSMLITEREGRLRIARDGVLNPTPIDGLPDILAHGQGGLMEVSVHPRFDENRFIYLTYASGTPRTNRTAMARARLVDDRLEDVQEIFHVSQDKSGGQHFGSRIVWLPDATMLLAIGDGGNPPVRLGDALIREQAQNPLSHLGKVLRLNDDGTPPTDNPFSTQNNADPLLYTLGHRNIQGMTIDDQGRVWATEHGARGGDELNLIIPGLNYGWPAVTFSVDYAGGRQISPDTTRPGFVDPLLVWTPSIAPSGLLFYTGDALPQWRGMLLAGALMSQDVQILQLSPEGQVTRQQRLTVGERVRDVRQGPDDLIYILTDEQDGKVYRVRPQ